MALHVSTFDESGTALIENPDEISDLIEASSCLVWIDVTDAGAADFDELARELSLHPLALEDARKHGQRPKIETYPTHAFVVAYSRDLAEVDCFIGPNWIVTVRGRGKSGEPFPIEAVRRRFERLADGIPSVALLLYVLLDDIVDGYFTAADAFEDEVEEFEQSVLSGEATGREDGDRVQQDLVRLRRELVEFRRRVIPMRDVLNAILRADITWLDDRDLSVHFQDVYDHVLRAVDQLDAQRELLGNAVDAHLAILSNRMNSVMKLMTSVGAILLGSTLIAGIYGMNFEHMPELGWKYGYPFALGLMVAITVAGVAYFRRRDWL